MGFAAVMRFSNFQLQLCAERELRLRRRVYPNRVSTGRMKMHDAELQIAMMAQIADDYADRATADAERERLL
jgi:hypothetical protein